jgi:hypothetical protein
MSVIRVQKLPSNYVTIHKGFLEDKEISLQLKGFLAYCLAKPDDWVFYVTQLSSALKEGRDALYTIINEGIKFGYITRDSQKTEKGQFKGCDYRIFEIPKKSYDIAIKDFIAVSGKPDAVAPVVAKSTLLKNNSYSSSSVPSEENNKKKEPSAVASYLTNLFLEKIKERLPKFKEPDREKWTEEMDRLMRLDGRTEEEVRSVIMWIHKEAPAWYKAHTLSVDGLRKKFDVISSLMAADKDNNIIRLNRKYAQELKAKYPAQMKSMTFDARYVTNTFNSKDLPFSMPHDQFKRLLVEIFGGRYND